jgi:2'-hydroxyisoflavone reductase
MIVRRTFLQASLAASALAYAGRLQAAPAKKLKILILGGTGFLGPALVEAARPRGHTLTLFNRGKTNPGMFADIEQLHGDRDGKIDTLKDRKWDAVVDDSGYVPRHVRLTAELLKPNVPTYVFVSTISVYSDEKTPNQDESGPRHILPADKKDTEKVGPDTYGALKALCEDVVSAAYGDGGLTVRPGLIVGPRDPTDRFTYWPVRVDRGGDILAPGDGSDPVQFIDVRDLAGWIISALEAGTKGTYTAVGPAKKLPMKELLAACQKASKTKGKLVWASADWLDAHKVEAWSDMPVWIPDNGLAQLSAAKAIGKGMTFRPIEQTVRDTLAWWKTQPEDRRAKLKAGLAPEREHELLAELAKK